MKGVWLIRYEKEVVIWEPVCLECTDEGEIAEHLLRPILPDTYKHQCCRCEKIW